MAKNLKKGDRGPDVVELQHELNSVQLLPEDGQFGDWTDSVVRVFQSSRGLVSDGIVGERTQAALDYELGLPPDPGPRPCPGPDPEDKFTLSLYTHKTGSSILASDWLKAARDLGFSRLYIQTNSQGEGHTLSKMGGSASILADVCDKVRSYQLEPCLYTWAPRKTQISDTFDGTEKLPPLPAIMAACEITRCDWGEEGANLLSTSDVDSMRAFLAGLKQYVWSWDTHAARYTPSMDMLLAPEVTVGVCQAYHYYASDKPDRWWGSPQGPGNRQEYALRQAAAVGVKRPTPFASQAVILALWNQYSASAVQASGYSTHSGDESIMEGVSMLWDAGIRDLRFWRDEHVEFAWTRHAIEEMQRRGWI